MKTTTKEYQEALDNLHRWIKPGDTLYTILENVSRSGMTREIRTLILKADNGKVVDIHPNHAVATVLGYSRSKHGNGIKIQGCGMDMGFALVYNLSRVLFPKGFGCIGEGCPSNDHSNGDRDRTVHGSVIGYTPATINKLTKEYTTSQPKLAQHWHNDGGYALNHQWL